MTEISIGMKRERARRLAAEIMAIPDDQPLEVVLHGQDDATESAAIVTISNEDMERADLPDEAVLVEIEPD
jgi:hypothetical protein